MQDESLVKTNTSMDLAQLDFQKCASIFTNDFVLCLPFLSFI